MIDICAIDGGKPIREDFLVFGSPLIEQEDINEVVDSLNKGWIGTGPKVNKLEDAFSKYIGCKHAIAVNSCTSALHLSMLVSNTKQNDEVITTPMTFCATANSIIHIGAKPVFVDINKDTLNIDTDKIEDAITSKTKAIIPVHFAGRPCNLDTLKSLKKSYDLTLIEDAAHAIESSYKNHKIGTVGDLTCFSFYVTKNITTGEGGMVTTSSDEWAEKIKMYALHGMSKDAWRRYSDEGFKHYEVVFPGYKYNMMDIQAALGIHQLKRIEEYQKKRIDIWNQYNKAFSDLPIITPTDPEKDTVHARHLYTILIDIDQLKVDRDFIQHALFKENIGTGIHYRALHLHPFYKKTFGYKRGDLPNAEFVSDRTISLPFSQKLSKKDVEDTINAVRKVLLAYKR